MCAFTEADHFSEEDFSTPTAWELAGCPENQLGMYPSSEPVQGVDDYADDEGYDSSDSDPDIYTREGDTALTLTKFSCVKQVLATKTNYNGGRFSTYLQDQFGCLILPLWAVSKLRVPSGGHKCDPPCFVFVPPSGPDHTLYDNFSEAAEQFFDMAHLDSEYVSEEKVPESK